MDMRSRVEITPEGFAKLESELQELIDIRRPQVAAMIRDAKEDGDLRENAAFDEAKEQQGFVEGKIQELEDLLRRALIIVHEKGSAVITLGSKVEVEETGESPETFSIVGSAEADPIKSKISNVSPLGAALMGKRKGDTVKYEAPGGIEMTFKILSVG
jgi:transcription elongation factor GreA